MNRKGFASLLLSGAASLGLVFGVAAGPANAASGYFQIKNFGSNMCLQPSPANSTDVGVQLEQHPCANTSAQKWAPIGLGSGKYRFFNQSTGGCMDAHGANVDGTPVDTWPCSTISNETWAPASTFPNVVPMRIISKVSNGSRCLDVTGGSLAAGAPIQIYRCTSENAAQVWFLQAVA